MRGRGGYAGTRGMEENGNNTKQHLNVKYAENHKKMRIQKKNNL